MSAEFLDARLPDRFWSKCSPCPMSGCWLWIGRTQSIGYGVFDLLDKGVVAHRVSYGALVGEVPAGLELDHLCRVRSCVNPSHLEAVTHAENMRRGAHAQKTECPKGHPYNLQNTRICKDRGGGLQRLCLTCKRGSSRAAREAAGAVPSVSRRRFA